MNTRELKFLVDVGVGKAIEAYLQAEGYDIKAVRNIDPCMKDEDIIRTENYSDRLKNCFCVFQNDKFRIRKIAR